MEKNIFKKIKNYLPIIGIIIFIYLIYSLGVNDIYESFKSVNPIYIIITLSLTFPRVIIRNIAWQQIQREHKIKLKFWQSLKIFLIGFFYGSITPGYIGQLMRIPYMKERTNEPYGKLFVNSTIESIVHTFSMFCMILLGAFLVIGTYPELFAISFLWIIFMILILLFFIKKERGEKFFFILIKFLIPKSLRKNINRFVSTFYTEFPKPYRLIPPLLVGVITWIIIFSQEYIIIIAMNINIPYLYFLLLFPVANAMGFIPISPAGLGIRELTSIFIFSTLFGISEADIFVFTLLGFIVTDVFTGFIGFLVSIGETRYKKIGANKLKN